MKSGSEPPTRPSGSQVLARRWVVEVVFTQLTKADVFTLLAGGQNVADFDLVVGDDNTVNQQQHELSALLKGGIRQPVLHPPTKGLQEAAIQASCCWRCASLRRSSSWPASASRRWSGLRRRRLYSSSGRTA